jgi:osmotically-inducible protein OsmY
VEPTLPSGAPLADDRAVAEALRSFVCALGAATADVHVEYDAGVVTLTGAVATATQQQAVEDLVRAHDGVTDVVSELRIAVPGVVASGF